jgi:hypothetical protein
MGRVELDITADYRRRHDTRRGDPAAGAGRAAMRRHLLMPSVGCSGAGSALQTVVGLAKTNFA